MCCIRLPLQETIYADTVLAILEVKMRMLLVEQLMEMLEDAADEGGDGCTQDGVCRERVTEVEGGGWGPSRLGGRVVEAVIHSLGDTAGQRRLPIVSPLISHQPSKASSCGVGRTEEEGVLMYCLPRHYPHPCPLPLYGYFGRRWLTRTRH